MTEKLNWTDGACPRLHPDETDEGERSVAFLFEAIFNGTSIGTSKSPFFADLHFADVLKQEEPWA